ncbi:MFS transporter [Lacticaseibacillus mingshuiensis]|uniref:MFS transporter n=1 Tax=Lacticaseibacillus mingshuiensis TaxID=2799574 RepID=A0ABW4CGW9_9LACO|nr:MFS transporter [Lacticaseibacillus mingshuiensis]
MNPSPLAIPNWRRNFLIFLTGQFLSGITSMIVQYAIIWYLTMQTGSASMLSFASLLGMLPTVLLSPFVGGLIDRTNKKALLIISDAVVALFAVILFVAGSLQATFPLWLVFISLFMRALAQTFQQPTIQSVLPEMVPADDLTRANGQLGMISSANFIIAPALGAFLFSLVEIRFLILLDVIGFLIGAGLLLLVTLPDHHHETRSEPVHPLADAKAGLQLLATRRGLLIITLIGTLFTLFFMPVGSMYPLMTVQFFHGTVAQAGIVEVVWSVGMLAGGFIISIWKNWSDRMRPMILSYFVVGVTIGAAAFLPGNTHGFWWFVALNAVAGLAVPFFNTLLMAMIQQSFAPSTLGRVMGVLNSLMSISGPIGLIMAGPVGDALGVQNLFLIGGIGSLLCGLLTLILPAARHYDRDLQAEK